MLKVGFLLYSLRGGGAERMVSRLANAFIEKGIQTTVIVFLDEDIAYSINSKVEIVRCSELCENKIKRRLHAIREIRKIIKRKKLDVLLAFTASMPKYAMLAAAGLPCRAIGAERANPNSLGMVARLESGFVSLLCDGYVFQTEGAMKCYPAITQRKATIIGNISPTVSAACIKRKDSAICTVGRLHQDKDYSTLLHAVAKVRKINCEVTLAIFGDGEQKRELIELAKALNIADAVFFEGFKKNVLEHIQEYSVFAFSSKAEGMPNALLEAMAAGLPCVATNCDFGPADLINDGDNGFLVPVGDSDRMAERLLELLSNWELRERIGKEAAKVKDIYSQEVVTQAYIDYIEKIIHGRKN